MSLFNKKTISRAIAPAILGTDTPDASKRALLSKCAATIKSGEIETPKETALHGNFKSKIIVDVLGYRDFNDSGAWTVDVEAQIGAGSTMRSLARASRWASSCRPRQHPNGH